MTLRRSAACPLAIRTTDLPAPSPSGLAGSWSVDGGGPRVRSASLTPCVLLRTIPPFLPRAPSQSVCDFLVRQRLVCASSVPPCGARAKPRHDVGLCHFLRSRSVMCKPHFISVSAMLTKHIPKASREMRQTVNRVLEKKNTMLSGDGSVESKMPRNVSLPKIIKDRYATP